MGTSLGVLNNFLWQSNSESQVSQWLPRRGDCCFCRLCQYPWEFLFLGILVCEIILFCGIWLFSNILVVTELSQSIILFASSNVNKCRSLILSDVVKAGFISRYTYQKVCLASISFSSPEIYTSLQNAWLGWWPNFFFCCS